MHEHGHYFAAGPAALPMTVKQQVQAAIIEYHDTGLSILELSHRSDAFGQILDSARQLMRDLYAVPANFHILFMQGGASQHFDALPLNLMGQAKLASYVTTGLWSHKAARLAQKYTSVETIDGLAEQQGQRYCIDSSAWQFNPDSAYLHFTPNETVDGIQTDDPIALPLPVAADMTSCLMMRAIDFSRYGMIYAGTQKTLGIAGLNVIIVRDDLLDRARADTPELYLYDFLARENSIVNTAPVFACFVMDLMLQWIQQQGGIQAMEAASRTRSEIIYQAIDSNPVWVTQVAAQSRSLINAVFAGQTTAQTEWLLAEAEACGLWGLRGHRKIGGVRASMYNGTPLMAVEQLAELIQAAR